MLPTKFRFIWPSGFKGEDTNEAIIIGTCISKKNRQQKKKYKRTNNDLPNIHIKLKI